ncbi:MAG: CotH kinase family protein [Granulosicoccus sp.]
MKISTVGAFVLFILTTMLTLGNPAYSAPGNPDMLSPAGPVDTPTPEFVWRDQPDANEYRMFVYDRSVRARIHQENYNRADICDGTVCRVTPDISLGFSSKHQWRVRAYNNDGISTYSSLFFSLVEEPPAVVTTVAPQGDIQTRSPAFVWRQQSNATSYRLFVRDRTAGLDVLAVTYDASDVCSAGLCEVTPSGLALNLNPGNDLFFRVRGRNSGGWGNWPDWAARSSFVYAPTLSNLAPIARNDSFALDITTPITLSVLDNDQDNDGIIAPESIAVVAQPANGIATPQADGSILYVRTDTAAVSDSFAYTVLDNEGAASNVAVVVVTLDTQSGPELELAGLDLSWAGFPLIADDDGNRLFVSLGDTFGSPSTLVGSVLFSALRPGYSLQIAGTDITSGSELSAIVQHGSTIPVLVFNGEQLVQSYDLIVTNLPLFEVWAFDIVDEPKLPGAWRWADGQTDTDTGIQNLGIEIRGRTSQAFDKKSFSFETRELDDPDDSDNVRVFGLRNDDDWIADAAYRDLALVRNLVSHDIYRDMRSSAYIDNDGEAQGQSTIAGVVAEMVLNGGYNGLYVISERVDRKLLGLSKLDVPEDAEGNERWDQIDFSDPANGTLLYKAATNNADFYNPENVSIDFELKYPDPDDVVRFEPLTELLNFINFSDDTTFYADIGNRVDLESLADFWILRLLTSNRDTFKKNYYVARNQSQKWFFVPWDFDATYGLRWTGAEDPGSIQHIAPQFNRLAGRLVELGVSGFTSLVRTRWLELRSDLITPAAIASRFSDYFAQIGIDQTGLAESPRNRNLQRWPGTGNISTGQFELGQSAYIEQWLTQRLSFIDSYIDNLPGASQ